MTKSTFETRLGRCYELAWKRATEFDGATLIHGTISREGVRMNNPHAWVRLPNGECWEPITQMAMSEQAFNRMWGAKILHEFTAAEAATLALVTGVYGPWEEGE
jgi:hypothetical protein